MVVTKDGSTFNVHVGMGLVQNGILCTRYESSSIVTTAEQCIVLANKRPLLLCCYYYSHSSANLSQFWENQMWKLRFCCFFFLMRNPKTERAFTGYASSTDPVNVLLSLTFLFYMYRVVYRCMPETSGQLWPETYIVVCVSAQVVDLFVRVESGHTVYHASMLIEAPPWMICLCLWVILVTANALFEWLIMRLDDPWL